MARVKLTAERGFQAAKELIAAGDEVNSNTIWVHCEYVGSPNTAQKWAELWNAFERGEEVEPKLEKYRPAYEAVKRGGDPLGEFVAPEDEAVIPQVEGAVSELAHTLSEIVSQLVEERTRQIAEASSETVKGEQERAACAVEELCRMEKEREQAQKRIETLSEQQKTLSESSRELGGIAQQQKVQLEEVTLQRHSLEEQNRELSRQLGEAVEKQASLVKEVGSAQERQSSLQDELDAAQKLGRELDGQLREVERDKAICEARKTDGEAQVEREKVRYGELEERYNALIAQLVEKEGRAATAEEKVRQFAVQISQLQQEIDELRGGGASKPVRRRAVQEKEK
ncbi:MAG: hypothetical protein F6J86_06620 [Symploca sp. SIO1B1]|nr:hypothetical protein [Symploca sp. SIO1B1]